MNENHPPDSIHPASSAISSQSESDSPGYRILVADEQAALAIDSSRLVRAVRLILADSQIPSAYVSIAVVDDPTIHSLNVQYLNHNYPTDVLSFALEESADRLEGELVVSSDTAIREASAAGWSPLDELLLYVIHGTLHLVGYDDHSPGDQVEMYTAEAHYLSRMGVDLPPEKSRWTELAGKDSLP